MVHKVFQHICLQTTKAEILLQNIDPNRRRLFIAAKMWSLPADENTLDKGRFMSSPFCSYSSRCHRKNELSNYLLSVEVEGKVSVLMGLASASGKYHHKEESSIKREVFSLSLSVYARKGYLVPEAHTKISDQGVDFDVEAMEIGMEDILIVTSEHER